MRRFSILACAIVVLSLAACANPQEKLAERGATPYTEAEVRALISGKTEIWSNGAAYYSPDGALVATWKGQDYTGTWSTTEAGEACQHVPTWRLVPCTAYFHDGDMLTWMYKKQLNTISIEETYMDGNHVSDF